MDVKKYIALGVSAVLVLTGGLLSIKSSGTNIKAGAGSEENAEVETMRDLHKLFNRGIESATLITAGKSSMTKSESMYYDDESYVDSSTTMVEWKATEYFTEEEEYTEVESVMHIQEYYEGDEETVTTSYTVELTYAIYYNEDGDSLIRVDKYEIGIEWDYKGEDEEDYEEEFEESKEEYEESVEAIGEYLGEWLEYDSVDDNLFRMVLSEIRYSSKLSSNGYYYFEMFASDYDNKDVFKKESDEVYKMKSSAFMDMYNGIGNLKIDLSLVESPTISYMYVGGSEYDEDDEDDYGYDYGYDYDDMLDYFRSECVMAEFIMTNINNTEIKAPKRMDVERF